MAVSTRRLTGANTSSQKRADPISAALASPIPRSGRSYDFRRIPRQRNVCRPLASKVRHRLRLQIGKELVALFNKRKVELVRKGTFRCSNAAACLLREIRYHCPSLKPCRSSRLRVGLVESTGPCHHRIDAVSPSSQLQVRRQKMLLAEAVQDPSDRLQQILADVTVGSSVSESEARSVGPVQPSSEELVLACPSTCTPKLTHGGSSEETYATTGAEQPGSPDAPTREAPRPRHPATVCSQGGGRSRDSTLQSEMTPPGSARLLSAKSDLSSEPGRPLDVTAGEKGRSRGPQVRARESPSAYRETPSNSQATRKSGGCCGTASGTTTESAQAKCLPVRTARLCPGPPRPCSISTSPSSVPVSVPSSRPSADSSSLSSPGLSRSFPPSERGSDGPFANVGEGQRSVVSSPLSSAPARSAKQPLSRNLTPEASRPCPCPGPRSLPSPSCQVSHLQAMSSQRTSASAEVPYPAVSPPRGPQLHAVTGSPNSPIVSDGHGQRPQQASATVVLGDASLSRPPRTRSRSSSPERSGQDSELLERHRPGELEADGALARADVIHAHLASAMTGPTSAAPVGEQQPPEVLVQRATPGCQTDNSVLEPAPLRKRLDREKELTEFLMKRPAPLAVDAERETEAGLASLSQGCPDSEQESKVVALDTPAAEDTSAVAPQECNSAQLKVDEGLVDRARQERVAPGDRSSENSDKRLDPFVLTKQVARAVLVEVDAALAEADEALRDAATAANSLLGAPISTAALTFLGSSKVEELHLQQDQRVRGQHEESRQQPTAQEPSHDHCVSGESPDYQDWHRVCRDRACFPAKSLSYPASPAAALGQPDEGAVPQAARLIRDCPDPGMTEEVRPSGDCNSGDRPLAASPRGAKSVDGHDPLRSRQTARENLRTTAAERPPFHTAGLTSVSTQASREPAPGSVGGHPGGVPRRTDASGSTTKKVGAIPPCQRVKSDCKERPVSFHAIERETMEDSEPSRFRLRNRAECCIAAMEGTLFCVRALARVGAGSGSKDNPSLGLGGVTFLGSECETAPDACYLTTGPQGAPRMPRSAMSNLEVSHGEAPTTLGGDRPVCSTSKDRLDSLVAVSAERSRPPAGRRTLAKREAAFPVAPASAAASPKAPFPASPQTELVATDPACNCSDTCLSGDSCTYSRSRTGNFDAERAAGAAKRDPRLRLPASLGPVAPALARPSALGTSDPGNPAAVSPGAVIQMEPRAQRSLKESCSAQPQAGAAATLRIGPIEQNSGFPTRESPSQEFWREKHLDSSRGPEVCQRSLPAPSLTDGFFLPSSPFPSNGQPLALWKPEDSRLTSYPGPKAAASCLLKLQLAGNTHSSVHESAPEVPISPGPTFCGPVRHTPGQMAPHLRISDNASAHAEGSPFAGRPQVTLSRLLVETARSEVKGDPVWHHHQPLLVPQSRSVTARLPNLPEKVRPGRNFLGVSSLIAGFTGAGAPVSFDRYGKRKPSHEAPYCPGVLKVGALTLNGKSGFRSCARSAGQVEESRLYQWAGLEDGELLPGAAACDARTSSLTSKGVATPLPSSTPDSASGHPWSSENLIAAATDLRLPKQINTKGAERSVEPELLRRPVSASRDDCTRSIARVPRHRRSWSQPDTLGKIKLDSPSAGKAPFHQHGHIGEAHEHPDLPLVWPPVLEYQLPDDRTSRDACHQAKQCQALQRSSETTWEKSFDSVGQVGNIPRGPGHDGRPDSVPHKRVPKKGHFLVLQAQRRARERKERLEQIKLR